MIIIDIPFPTMLKMMTGNVAGARFFYLNREKAIEVYTIMNGVLFRHIEEKKSEEQGLIWAETYLKDSVPILGMSHVNEDEWRGAFNSLSEKIDNIETLLKVKKEEEKNA